MRATVLCVALVVALALAAAPALAGTRTPLPASMREQLIRFNNTAREPVLENACNGKDYGTAGDFDFYVFAQSWPAEFCRTHKDWPGCKAPTRWMAQNFTLHGLWPNYKASRSGHNWPQCCQTKFGSDVDPTVIKALLPQLQTYWPNEQDPAGNSLSASLWGHEWGKHGTCSGMTQMDYFQKAMNIEISMPTPPIVHGNIGGAMLRSDLMAAPVFKSASCVPGGDCWTGFSCVGVGGVQYLSALTTCWNQALQRIVCPAVVLAAGGSQCNQPKVFLKSF